MREQDEDQPHLQVQEDQDEHFEDDDNWQAYVPIWLWLLSDCYLDIKMFTDFVLILKCSLKVYKLSKNKLSPALGSIEVELTFSVYSLWQLTANNSDNALEIRVLFSPTFTAFNVPVTFHLSSCYLFLVGEENRNN